MTIARVHGRQSTDEESFNAPAFAYLGEFTFDFTGTSAQSDPVTSGLVAAGVEQVLVRLAATSDCWLTFGASPTAVADQGVLLPAGVVEVWRMDKGHRIAAIQDSDAGTLSVVLLQ